MSVYDIYIYIYIVRSHLCKLSASVHCDNDPAGYQTLSSNDSRPQNRILH